MWPLVGGWRWPHWMALWLVHVPMQVSSDSSSQPATTCKIAAKHQCLRACYPELLGFELRNSDVIGEIPSEEGDIDWDGKHTECICDWEQDFLQAFLQHCQPKARTSVRVFSPGDHGAECYRIPVVTKTAHGSLLAFAEVRRGGCSDRRKVELAVSRSEDHGKTWSPVEFAVGNRTHPVGNPWPMAMQSGSIAVAYVTDILGSQRGNGNGIIFSEDDGVSWSAEVNISTELGVAKASHPGPNAGVELTLPTGGKRLLIAGHAEDYKGTYISYSDDAGKSWNTIPVAKAPLTGMTEPGLADLGNGELLLQMRHKREDAWGKGISRSSDYGMTWSEVKFDAALNGPVCQASIMAYGGSVYFANTANDKKRSNMRIRRSDDGGRTWLPKTWLVQKHPSMGYTSLVQGPLGPTEDGRKSGILYESITTGAIDFKIFPLDFASEAVEPSLFIA
mmetsp:Transcript_61151/g.145653  ORF Transcript_61151/g.145653 Transcript_61151/m.145653 type:complete len:448 (+) Transcript_61151:71-1414(+)